MPPCPAPDACYMYLIRHGATENNLQNPPRLQGRRSDLGLSAEGLGQAERTAEFLNEMPFAAVYSSPLRRARQTAEIIAQPHQLDVGVLEDIAEIDVGNWEERVWSEIAESEPLAYKNFMSNPAIHGYEGGENLTDVHERVLPALQEAMHSNAGRRIAVVAHNVVNRVFLASLLGLPISRARDLSQDNCGVNVIRLQKDEFKLRTFNATFHLESQ